jgi:hypothetical protein
MKTLKAMKLLDGSSLRTAAGVNKLNKAVKVLNIAQSLGKPLDEAAKDFDKFEKDTM